MRVYAAGCGGMLGDAVAKRFSEDTLLITDSECDVRDYSKVYRTVREFEPEVILNLAAITSLEQCESDPGAAWSVNATPILAQLSLEYDATYVFISSGEVFDGTRDFDSDEDQPNPHSVYSRSKRCGELIASMIPKHYVLRAAWMMGGGPEKDKKFINQIYKQIQQGRTELRVVDDIVGTPTYTVDFADGMHKILEARPPYGVYNQACTGNCTRYDMAVEFVRLLGLQDTVSVIPIKSIAALRQPRQCLRNDKLNALGLNVMRDWRAALSEYSEEFL
jgi:dTDP-4-dehydrorhamnose reductase